MSREKDVSERELDYLLAMSDAITLDLYRAMKEKKGEEERWLDLTGRDWLSRGVLNQYAAGQWDKVMAGRKTLLEEEKAGFKEGFRFCAFHDPDYPARLAEVKNAPMGFWYYGTLRWPEHSVAVIGSRQCTSYGKEAAEYLASLMAANGVGVISGMARGIDSAAHKAALLSGGLTVAVLGGGVDICYPGENRDLYEELKKRGCVLSETPPHLPGVKYRYPRRNRIIAGCADCLVVTEAREKSGTFTTFEAAAEMGRDVFAVPGRMTEPQSRGCNRMIRDGAHILSGVDDLFDFFGIRQPKEPEGEKLENFDGWVYTLIPFSGINLTELSELTCLPMGELQGILWRLESRQLVRMTGKNSYRRTFFPCQ